MTFDPTEDASALGARVRADIAAAIPGHVRSNPDFRLIFLASMLVLRWADETRAVMRCTADPSPEADEAATAAVDHTGEIVDHIVTEEARTFIGLGVKALALAWLREGELHEDVASDDYEDGQDRLAATIRRQVLALDEQAAARAEGAS